jgi:hypothetical protein
MYSSLMAGAEGIFFYTYLHSTRYNAELKKVGKWPYEAAGELPDVAPQMWQNAKRCVTEMKILFELLIDAVPSSTVRLATDVRGIDVQSWKTPRGTLVLWSNATYVSRSIELVGLTQPRTVKRLQHDRWEIATLEDSTLTLTLPGPGGGCLLLQDSQVVPSTSAPEFQSGDGADDLRVGGSGL